MPGVFRVRLSLWVKENWRTSLEGDPRLMMCLDRTLLIWLREVLTKGKNAIERWSSLHGDGGGRALIGGLRTWRIRFLSCPLFLKVSCRNLSE